MDDVTLPKKFLPAREVFLQNKGMLRTSQAMKLGIHPEILYAMREAGFLVQENRGLYRLAQIEAVGKPDWVQVALLVPKAVICLISALEFYDLTTQIPHRVYITLPKGTQTPHLKKPFLDITRRGSAGYNAGIQEYSFDDIPVRVYSREKTIADCVRFRNKIGQDVMLEALREYRRQGNLNIQDVMNFAHINRVGTLMTRYLEILL